MNQDGFSKRDGLIDKACIVAARHDDLNYAAHPLTHVVTA